MLLKHYQAMLLLTRTDHISVNMLKRSPYVVYEALSIIFNKSPSTGIFSDNWKSAIVVPVHKKGDIYDHNNYRPISLLPVISSVRKTC